ncbi:MAG: radical SAM protein [Anaerolineales bacterium]|jgi:organic radical activating enzyme|nr:radical SAM protein [Anaerolineales bacterium]
MTGLLKSFQQLFAPRQAIPAGVYDYQSPPDDPRNYRLHLRREETGDGILIVNASSILHLNRTAADYAYYFVHNANADSVAERMSTRYAIDPEIARQDYLNFAERIRIMIETPDLDPVTFLDFERRLPFSGRLSAPYRLDCALTYRLSDDQASDSAPVERVERELTTSEWKKILQKAWDAGIPHIIFTGGEPTLRADLVELISFAEGLGQVTGVLSDGLKLSEPAYLNALLQAGLDHLMVVLHPESDVSWQAVKNAMVEDLSVVVHVTLTEDNQSAYKDIFNRLASLEVQKVSLSAAHPELSAALAAAREWLASLDLELVWNLPVPYSALHPVALETDDAKIEGAGRAWLYIEPDGDVLSAQSNPTVLGNFLNDPWIKIWKGRAEPA